MVDVIRTKAMLCWIRSDFLRCYETSILNERIRDRYSSSRHLKYIDLQSKYAGAKWGDGYIEWPRCSMLKASIPIAALACD